MSPPLAFARVGPSKQFCDSFYWGLNDLETGKTTIKEAETLSMNEDGSISAPYVPNQIRFKEPGVGFKPVCPYFELYGIWNENGNENEIPITPDILDKIGKKLHDLTWRVEVANLKAYHITLAEGDKITASVELRGDDTSSKSLLGASPDSAPEPLVPNDKRIPLGTIRINRPSKEFPFLRLRFIPSSGFVYGPTNLAEREEESTEDGEPLIKYWVPAERLILNRNALWCRYDWQSRPDDRRTRPKGLYAMYKKGNKEISAGLVDDVCDGIISCTLEGVGTAYARIVVAPPKYAPDRRPFTSIADGLADRVQRTDVTDQSYVEEENSEIATLEVHDFMERVLETVELINVDYQNVRARIENIDVARALEEQEPNAAADKAFRPRKPQPDTPLPLTDFARQKHRKLVTLGGFEKMLRQRPTLIDDRVRKPMTEDRYYDKKMPALIRGSDGYPMHITRRQYELLVRWASYVRKKAEANR